MAKIRMNEPTVRRIKGVQLRPGLQAVDDDKWGKIKKHPIGAKLIERGVLEEVKAKRPGRPSADDVASDMADIYDMDTLKGYLEDSRKTVSEAAQAQIDKINAQAK